MTSYVITIDGPAASGKSSVSRELSKRLLCPWVSTGSFYRGLGYVAMQMKVDLKDERKLAELAVSDIWSVHLGVEKTHVYFRGQDVTAEAHQEQAGTIASQISQYPMVRKMLLEPQRRVQSHRGLIAEGRDCGSVVYPYADLKVYLTADSEHRARRRAEEQGMVVEEVQKAQKTRDHQDLSRQTAPLQIPPGAQVVDTSHLTLLEVVDYVEGLARSFL